MSDKLAAIPKITPPPKAPPLAPGSETSETCNRLTQMLLKIHAGINRRVEISQNQEKIETSNESQKKVVDSVGRNRPNI